MAVQARRMWWGARRRWVSTSAGPERVVELVAETVPLAGWWGRTAGGVSCLGSTSIRPLMSPY